MFYAKNLPGWERWTRLVAGAAMIACGIYLHARMPGGWILAVIGVGTVATGLVGFCPACAMAGRRLDKRAAAMNKAVE